MSTASSVCLFPRPVSAQMTNWNHFVIVKWPSVFSEQVPYWSSPCLFSVALQRSVWRSILGSGRVRRLIKSQQGSLGQASGNPIVNVVRVVRSLDSEATAQLKCHCDLFLIVVSLFLYPCLMLQYFEQMSCFLLCLFLDYLSTLQTSEVGCQPVSEGRSPVLVGSRCSTLALGRTELTW